MARQLTAVVFDASGRKICRDTHYEHATRKSLLTEPGFLQARL